MIDLLAQGPIREYPLITALLIFIALMLGWNLPQPPWARKIWNTVTGKGKGKKQ